MFVTYGIQNSGEENDFNWFQRRREREEKLYVVTRLSVSVQFVLVVLHDTVRGRKDTAKICNKIFLNAVISSHLKT